MFFAKKGAIFVKFRFDFSCHNRKDMLTLLLIISFGFLFQLENHSDTTFLLSEEISMAQLWGGRFTKETDVRTFSRNIFNDIYIIN